MRVFDAFSRTRCTIPTKHPDFITILLTSGAEYSGYLSELLRKCGQWFRSVRTLDLGEECELSAAWVHLVLLACKSVTAFEGSDAMRYACFALKSLTEDGRTTREFVDQDGVGVLLQAISRAGCKDFLILTHACCLLARVATAQDAFVQSQLLGSTVVGTLLTCMAQHFQGSSSANKEERLLYQPAISAVSNLVDKLLKHPSSRQQLEEHHLTVVVAFGALEQCWLTQQPLLLPFVRCLRLDPTSSEMNEAIIALLCNLLQRERANVAALKELCRALDAYTRTSPSNLADLEGFADGVVQTQLAFIKQAKTSDSAVPGLCAIFELIILNPMRQRICGNKVMDTLLPILEEQLLRSMVQVYPALRDFASSTRQFLEPSHQMRIDTLLQAIPVPAPFITPAAKAPTPLPMDIDSAAIVSSETVTPAPH